MSVGFEKVYEWYCQPEAYIQKTKISVPKGDKCRKDGRKRRHGEEEIHIAKKKKIKYWKNIDAQALFRTALAETSLPEWLPIFIINSRRRFNVSKKFDKQSTKCNFWCPLTEMPTLLFYMEHIVYFWRFG